jgi:hypothetical protein
VSGGDEGWGHGPSPPTSFSPRRSSTGIVQARYRRGTEVRTVVFVAAHGMTHSQRGIAFRHIAETPHCAECRHPGSWPPSRRRLAWLQAVPLVVFARVWELGFRYWRRPSEGEMGHRMLLGDRPVNTREDWGRQ